MHLDSAVKTKSLIKNAFCEFAFSQDTYAKISQKANWVKFFDNANQNAPGYPVRGTRRTIYPGI
jgi:hypothetical protein